MRHHLAVVTVTVCLLPACGVSTLEMNQALSGSSTPAVVWKDDVPVPATDAGVLLDAGGPLVVAEDAGTPTPVDAGIPVECETGDTAPCTASCGSTGVKTCVSTHWALCRQPAESCDNGSDDDCDGRVDHHDTDCTPIVRTCESSEGGGCNGDPGYGDRCSAADNQNGCSAARFNAWCNRRNPEYPDIWDNWIRNWVDSRCDGTVQETGTQYSTWFCRSSTNEQFECTTPLVLSFDDAKVKYDATSRLFSFQPGNPVQSDWPSAVTPWLVRDVNGNGRIDDGSELFGSNTKTAAGVAKHGFEALAALDGNGDGTLDAKDPLFISVQVWRDVNGDRRSQPSELTSLAAERVDALSLGFTTEPRCDLGGNCERERSTFTWRRADGAMQQGSVIDVYLRVHRSRRAESWGPVASSR